MKDNLSNELTAKKGHFSGFGTFWNTLISV